LGFRVLGPLQVVVLGVAHGIVFLPVARPQ